MFPCKLIKPPSGSDFLPLTLYCIGYHNQTHLARPDGFSATQFFFGLKGKGVFHFCDGKNAYLSQGKAIVIPAKMAHEYYPLGDEPWSLAFVCFKEQKGTNLAGQLKLPCNQSFSVAGIEELGDSFSRLYQNDCSDMNKLIRSSVELYQFALLFASKYRTANAFEESEETSDSCQSVQRLAAAINSHYTENISFSGFSAKIGYSLQQLERLFKKEYGISPQSYLKMIRLQQSVNLMNENPGMHVDEVAKAVGLDANYYVRVFKNVFGVTPKQYKNNPFMLENSVYSFLHKLGRG